jgi:hypothetical protein
VLNLAGRPVRTLCADRDCPEGASALLWDARSDLGLAVPNGTYVIELTAKCADGSQARGVAPLRLAR